MLKKNGKDQNQVRELKRKINTIIIKKGKEEKRIMAETVSYVFQVVHK